jgi:hypothetical protein
MRKYPSIRTLQSVQDDIKTTQIKVGNDWMPARPQASKMTLLNRIKAAALVFSGKADALIWPGNQ